MYLTLVAKSIIRIYKLLYVAAIQNKRAAIALFVLALLFIFNLLSTPQKPPRFSYQVVDEQSDGEWIAIAQTGDEQRQGYRPDITALAFEPAGIIGIAAGSEGMLLATTDGGTLWRPIQSVPLDRNQYGEIDGEQVTSIHIGVDGRITAGVAVPESDYTAIYQLGDDGKWTRIVNNNGGIAAAADDGSLWVGGDGLIANRVNEEWSFTKLPSGEGKMLYGVAHADGISMVVGDDGFVAVSRDEGINWQSIACANPNATLHAAAIGDNAILAGGDRGNLWIATGTSTGTGNDNQFQQVSGLSLEDVIAAFHVDKESGRIFAAGGDVAGGSPFILTSDDGGKIWRYEDVGSAYGRVIALAKGRAGLFAATLDGHILLRRKADIAAN